MNFKLKAKRSIMVFIALMAINGYSQQSTVTINAGKPDTIVAQEVFGLLMERLGRQWGGQGSIFCGTGSTIPNTNGMRNDVIEGFKECGVGAAQWPGGCAANGYNWSTSKNPSNDVGVDRFIQFCKATGAEAVISLKPASGDVASNYAFASYIINDLKYPLKWVKIGNEIWGGCGTNYTNGYTTGSFTQNVEKLKELRSTENGKNLKIIAAAGSMEGQYGWIPTYYSQVANIMDGIEYHDYVYHTGTGGYSSSNPTTANYWQIMNDVFVGDFHSHLYNNIIPAMNAADPNKKVKIDFDEWGDWLQGDNWMQTITVMDAISAGGHLNQFVANADRVGVACLAQGVNVIHAIININTSGVMVKTPTFYVFKLYKPHHANNARMLPITASNFEKTNNVPIGNIAATIDAKDTINISFTNVDLAASRKVVVTLTNPKDAYKVYSADVVTGSAYTSTNPFGGAEQVNIKPLESSAYSLNGNVLTVTLPSKSVSMIRLARQGGNTLQSSIWKNISNNFSVKTGAHGTLLLKSNTARTSRVRVSLFSADGKALINNAAVSFESGSCVLGNNISKGIYLVKLTGENLNLTKQIVVER